MAESTYQFSCPSCGALLQAVLKQALTSVQCGECFDVFDVQMPNLYVTAPQCLIAGCHLRGFVSLRLHLSLMSVSQSVLRLTSGSPAPAARLCDTCSHARARIACCTRLASCAATSFRVAGKIPMPFRA